MRGESMRVLDHPILGKFKERKKVEFTFDGKKILAYEGEPIAAALMAAGIKILHYTEKAKEPRGVFCAIGRCNDCVMTVDGIPNVRTCITPVTAGIKVETQRGLGRWMR